MTSKRWTFLRKLAILYGVAAMLALGMTALGRVTDCAPHQIDGQCGMASFIGTSLGIAGAIAIVIAGHIRLAVLSAKTRDQRF